VIVVKTDEVKGDKFTRIPDDDPVYELLGELVSAHHTELAEAAIALVWVHDVKPDCDGHMMWGRAKKVSPLERTFHEHDFVIQINAAVWKELPPMPRRALLDHELHHCGVKTDDDGDETYYLRKHDVEDFVPIVRRYGLWKTDVEAFVNAAIGKEQAPLFDKPGDAEVLPSSVTIEAKHAPALRKIADEFRNSIPAGTSVTLETGGKSVTLSGKGKKS
jgi:hypothetical protein